MSTYLGLKWTTSRGRETYGYNVVTLTDQRTGKRYRAMGGGYDMVGTVFGEWLQETHQDELVQLAAREGWEDPQATRKQVKGFYGAFAYPDGKIILDGGCGLESMRRIAEVIGVQLERTYKPTGRNRGETTGWFVA